MNASGLLLIVVAFVFLWFVLVRPQRRRQTQQAAMLEGLAVGDEVVTAGGIYGRIVALEDDVVLVEIARGLEVRVARRAIGGVVPPEEEPGGEEPRDEGDAPDREDDRPPGSPAGEDGG